VVRLVLDILNHDAERLPRRLRALGVRFPRNKEEELSDRLAVLLQRYSASTIGEIDAREVLHEIFQTIYRTGVTIPARWVMLDKTVATLAGVALEVYPDFNVFEVARPYVVRLAGERYRPDRVAARMSSDVGRYAEALLDYPFQVSQLLDEFKDGDVEIRIRPEGFDEAVDKVEASANRLVLALVAAALVIGSAVVAVFAREAEIVGLSLLALPGILVALAIIAWLCVGIFRSGRW
jgi:ubiquinone biosynthesis protein